MPLVLHKIHYKKDSILSTKVVYKFLNSREEGSVETINKQGKFVDQKISVPHIDCSTGSHRKNKKSKKVSEEKMMSNNNYFMNKYLATKIILPCCLFFFVSCQSDEKQNKEVKTTEVVNLDWLDSFDFDGDGIKDKVHFDYSGGGHCCYKISIVLSSDKKVRKYPFEMDGGYLAGVDNSQPEQFDIKDIDNDGLPEIIMRIQTYNGESERLDTAWNRAYGLSSNDVVFEFENGRFITRDLLSNKKSDAK